jgi:hypothetical protein
VVVVPVPATVPVVIAVTIMVASFAGFIQLPTAVSYLMAMFAVLPLSIVKILLGFTHLFFAFVVTISGLDRSGAAKK